MQLLYNNCICLIGINNTLLTFESCNVASASFRSTFNVCCCCCTFFSVFTFAQTKIKGETEKGNVNCFVYGLVFGFGCNRIAYIFCFYTNIVGMPYGNKCTKIKEVFPSMQNSKFFSYLLKGFLIISIP